MDLQALLGSLEPALRPGTLVFAVVDDEKLVDAIAPEVTVREDEGLTAARRPCP